MKNLFGIRSAAFCLIKRGRVTAYIKRSKLDNNCSDSLIFKIFNTNWFKISDNWGQIW